MLPFDTAEFFTPSEDEHLHSFGSNRRAAACFVRTQPTGPIVIGHFIKIFDSMINSGIYIRSFPTGSGLTDGLSEDESVAVRALIR